jgi:hypothetical protein
MSCTRLGIKIDYNRDVANPSRVFHAMGGMVDGLNELHQAIFDSVGLDIILSAKLDRTIEGSLISVQEQSIVSDSKSKIIGNKLGVIDRILACTEEWLGKPNIVEDASQIQPLVDKYQAEIDNSFDRTEADQLNVTQIDAYRVAKGLEKIFNSKGKLSGRDKVFIGQNRNSEAPTTSLNQDSYFAKTADEMFTSREKYRHSQLIIGISKAAYDGNVWNFRWLSKVTGRKEFTAKILHTQWLDRWLNGKINIYPGYGLQVDIDVFLNCNNKRDKQAEITHVYGVIQKKDMEQTEMGYDKDDA